MSSSAAAGSSASGRTLQSHYTLGRVLGTGAFSTVNLATNVATGKQVAVKVINRSRVSSDARQERILRNEIDVMQKIVREVKHPNLIQMQDVFEEPTKLYIVLELLSGGELFDRIVSKGHFSEADASRLVAKLIAALKLLHDNGIIHRDMKPENILYATPDEDSECKITDFGLAHLTAGDDVHASLVGTPGYVAPEVLSRREYGPACDVWGMGVILYILLVGYPPFYADSNKELFRLIKRGEFYFHEDAWSGVSANAKDLVTRMLTLDVAARITTAQVLEHPFITGHNSTVHMAATIERMRKFNAKRKLRTAAMACVLGATLPIRRQLRELVGPSDLSAKEVDRIRTEFRKVATTAGQVTQEQFNVVMASLGYSTLALERLFLLFDRDGSGTVEYKEFLVGLGTLHGSNEDALRLCFQIYDEDSSGFISREELIKVLAAAGGPDAEDQLAKAAKLAELFERIDTDGDGQISFEEFRDGIRREPLLVRAFLPADPAAAASAAASSAATPTSPVASSPAAGASV